MCLILASLNLAIGLGDLGFDSRAGQIGRSVASGSPLLRRFFGAMLPVAKLRRWASPLVKCFGVIPRVE